MINKKNMLGTTPIELGMKDAVHAPIVSVRAAEFIKRGYRCSINKYNEAIPDNDGIGVADPFRKKDISTGDIFWLLVDPKEINNVLHVWEHETVKFEQPTRNVEYNKYLEKHAEYLGLTYFELMDACERVAHTEEPVEYTGNKDISNLDIDLYDIFYEWSSETGYEFENYGTECCPEYEFPDQLFKTYGA